MKVYWGLENGWVMLTSDVDDGAMCIEKGRMSDKDDSIEEIDWDNKRYRSQRDGWLPFPEKWYKIKDLHWSVYRVVTKIYE